MITWPNFLSQLFNGLAAGALLALISSGLTIIYGTLGVLNLAHGAMFMLGGYAGFAAYQATGSFVVAVVAGALAVMTFGVSIVFVEAIRFIFGSESRLVPSPEAFSGIVNMGFMMYPAYRLWLVGI